MVLVLLAAALEKAVEAQEAAQEAQVQEAEEEQAEVQAGEEWADTVWDLAVSAFARIAGIVFLTVEAFRAHRRYAQSAERG